MRDGSADGGGRWLMLWVLGIDFALLWAILSFLLYFIPVVGGIVMMVPPVREHREFDDP